MDIVIRDNIVWWRYLVFYWKWCLQAFIKIFSIITFKQIDPSTQTTIQSILVNVQKSVSPNIYMSECVVTTFSSIRDEYLYVIYEYLLPKTVSFTYKSVCKIYIRISVKYILMSTDMSASKWFKQHKTIANL